MGFVPPMRLLGLLALLAAAPAAAQDLQVTWDRDLAFDFDRDNYDRLIRRIVREGYGRVAADLGMAREAPLTIQIYTPARYAETFGAEAQQRRGAHYQRGVVHVNGGHRLDETFAALIEHELVHAVVDHRRTGYRLPAWLNEGLAERARWRRRQVERLAQGQIQELKQAAARGQLVPLPTRGPLTPFGYLQSFAAVSYVERTFGRDALLRLLHTTLERKGPFEDALLAALGRRPAELERELADWIRGQ